MIQWVDGHSQDLHMSLYGDLRGVMSCSYFDSNIFRR